MSEYNDYNWVDENMTLAHQHFVKPITEMLPTDGTPILDIGCGNGSLANHLIALGYNIYGTDAAVSGINIANQTNPGRFFLQDLSIDELPKELAHIKFSVIISTEVIEHLYNPQKYIIFCKSILEKSNGGVLIISTPYHGYLKNMILSLFNKWDFHFSPLWDGGHIKFWSFKTLKLLLERNDFKVIKFKGVGRFPYIWKSMIIKSTI